MPLSGTAKCGTYQSINVNETSMNINETSINVNETSINVNETSSDNKLNINL